MSYIENIIARQQRELAIRSNRLPSNVQPKIEGDDPVAAFEAFHNANPHVCQTLTKMALALKQRGWEVCSINLLFEQLRWLYALQTAGGSYLLNNNYRAYYARLIMAKEPELDGFFATRRQPNGEYEPSEDLV